METNPFVEYTGDGFATVVGLAAGPDGVYFTGLYGDSGTLGPTTPSGRVIRISYGDSEDCNQNGLLDACELATGLSDFDNNGQLDSCDALSASTNGASVAIVGQIDFALRAGQEHAGQNYQLLGSITGSAPGTLYGNVLLPLSIQNDAWFFLTATVFSSAILQNTVGLLDANGNAQAALQVPPIASLLGLQFHHAYLVSDTVTQQVIFASNAMPLLMDL